MYIILPGACTLNTVLARRGSIHFTARGAHIKHSAGRGGGHTFYCQGRAH